MDQDEFRTTYRDVNERACIFERAVLTNQCDCPQAERFCIAEREGVACGTETGNARCGAFVALVREHARFALKPDPTESRSALPYGKAMRVQVGGLRGLFSLMEPDLPVPQSIEDVEGLITHAESRFGGLEALPFSQLMPHLAAYRGRTRSRRRPSSS